MYKRQGQQRAVTRLEQGIARASHLVEQLLQLAREETGDTTAVPRRHAVQPVLQLAVADVLPQAQARRIDVGLTPGSAHDPVTSATPESLRILLRNLLENAIKYGPEDSAVDIGLAQDSQGRPVLTIDDAGPGIPAAERDRVFDRFYRSPDLAVQAAGSGLGLAIVRTIAQNQDIAVALEDAPGDHGLRVRLTLPRPAG